MTVQAWLMGRTPPPPRALAERLDVIMQQAGADASKSVAEALLDSSDRLIAALLRPEGATRDSALDLLAADALVSYAMEAAAEEISALERCAATAMARISSIADRVSAVA